MRVYGIVVLSLFSIGILQEYFGNFDFTGAVLRYHLALRYTVSQPFG